MSIDPTREEWQAAWLRASKAVYAGAATNTIVEAALGPCPPEPAPREWRSGGLLVTGHDNDVWVGFQRIAHEALTPDEADAMSKALAEHARYAREQRAPQETVCGQKTHCQRPEGHPGSCRPYRVVGDDDA